MTGLVYLASYPRSGNTLLRMILWQCFGLKTVSEYDEEPRWTANPDWLSLVGSVQHWDTDFLVRLDDEQGVVPFKTHAHPENMAYRERPAIYVIRDGREACVSYWRYHHDILGRGDVSLRDVIRGDCLFGSWSAHVRAWNPVDALCLFYENMVTDLEANVGLIARFLQREADPLLCLSVGDPITPWDQLHQTDPAFFRSGTNDTWRELMTDDDLRLFDELHGDTMREYGYCKEVSYA